MAGPRARVENLKSKFEADEPLKKIEFDEVEIGESDKDYAILLKDDVLQRLNPQIPVRPSKKSLATLEAAISARANTAKTQYYVFDCADQKESISKYPQEMRGVVCSLHGEDIYDFTYLFDTTDQAVEDKLRSENASTIRAMRRKPMKVQVWRELTESRDRADSYVDHILNSTPDEYKELMMALDAAQWKEIEKYILNESSSTKKAPKLKETKKNEDETAAEVLTKLQKIKEVFEEAIDKDVKDYLKRHPGADKNASRDHILNSAKDLLAIMPTIDGAHEVPKVFWLYKSLPSHTMKAFKDYAYALGFHGWAITHIQANFQDQAEYVSLPPAPRRPDEDERSDFGHDSDPEKTASTESSSGSSPQSTPTSGRRNLSRGKSASEEKGQTFYEATPPIDISGANTAGRLSRTQSVSSLLTPNMKSSSSSPPPVMSTSSTPPTKEEYLGILISPLRMGLRQAKRPEELAESCLKFKENSLTSSLTEIAKRIIDLCKEEKISELRIEKIMYAFLGHVLSKESPQEIASTLMLLKDELNLPFISMANDICVFCEEKKTSSLLKKQIVLHFLALNLKNIESVDEIVKLVIKFSKLLDIPLKEVTEIGFQGVAKEKKEEVWPELLDKVQHSGSTGKITSVINKATTSGSGGGGHRATPSSATSLTAGRPGSAPTASRGGIFGGSSHSHYTYTGSSVGGRGATARSTETTSSYTPYRVPYAGAVKK